MWLYNIAMTLYGWLMKLAALRHPKARLWIDGRRDLFSRLQSAIAANGPGQRIVWIHVASLGEFEQGRPIVERIRREYPDYKILVTFYSPSGYEIRKNYPGADYICYLPNDTRRNARRFVELVQPAAAIFVKYEFWLNTLAELRRRKVPAYIVSAIFRRNSVFFRWYGGLWRQALTTFRVLFVQNEDSKKLLAELGFDNVTVAGDTRFDRVAEIAAAARRIELIERFKGDGRLFVAGSTWGPDEELLLQLAAENPEIRFVIAPHEFEEGRIAHILETFAGRACRYTACTPESDFSAMQILVLDTMGMLSSVYGYAEWAYIGGGFGVGIHNTLEAATFGLPLAFGPNYLKFKEACDLVELGAARPVSNYTELQHWFVPLCDDEALRRQISQRAKTYTASNQGATELILHTVFRP